MGYTILADILVVIHFLFVAFVVVGQLLIMIGAPLGWRWTRNFWFRLGHLACIAVVAAEAAANVKCPCTVWEDQLRAAARQPVSEGTFMGRLAHNLLFYDVDAALFPPMHMLFGALVLETFLLFPPRWPRRTNPKPSWRWSLFVGGNLCGAAAVLCLALAVRIMLNPTRVSEDASDEQRQQAELVITGENQLAARYDKIAGALGALGIVACMLSMRFTPTPPPRPRKPKAEGGRREPPAPAELNPPAPAKAETGGRLTP
ncbi:MAG TPA: DUF2784 domain-containing protein [Gemmataceae bacterium]|jgi:hypothetical protein|nr:DUF2784 domain-containing protein [Gemmataceae bacterium]